ncbi:Ribonuclease Z [Halomicronema hongdechloris C2206]|uniref:Ribonuclease Z n=1 Tax=Halomicronema hongdechloris C2206 TaxID=1641165 RepID=A0A1Z3HMF7_9CYAN|nr:MBL fold metallo-hydrolase [Halomicronema hongdechloris]ASC71468.1 Ribonuclease Z [Halomicronema hongdechloris C2206]
MPETDSSSSDVIFQLNSSDHISHETFTVQFWGVRGSVPAPGAETIRYGGNTACVEVLVGGQRLILDGGTGLRTLGKHLLRHQDSIKAHLFFTHTHWDRIQGFPFFFPAFAEENCFHIYGAPAPNGASIKQCLTDQMLRPNFTIPLQKMRSHLHFHNISAGNVIPLGDVLVETIALNHQTSSLGFRISWQGYTLVYATDTDHSHDSVDPNLLYLANEADVLIYDGTYADTYYHDLNCSGAVPWQLGVDAARAANVGKLIMFHHNPCHDDNQLDQLEAEIRSQFQATYLAREGMVVKIA